MLQCSLICRHVLCERLSVCVVRAECWATSRSLEWLSLGLCIKAGERLRVIPRGSELGDFQENTTCMQGL